MSVTHSSFLTAVEPPLFVQYLAGRFVLEEGYRFVVPEMHEAGAVQIDGMTPRQIENMPIFFFLPRCTQFLSENGISVVLARPEKSHLTLLLPIFEDTVARAFTSTWIVESALTALHVNIPRYGTFRTMHIHCVRDKELPLATELHLLPPNLSTVVKTTSWVISLPDKTVSMNRDIDAIRYRALSHALQDAVRYFDPAQSMDRQIFQRWWRLLFKPSAWRIGWWLLRNITVEDSTQKDVSNDEN